MTHHRLTDVVALVLSLALAGCSSSDDAPNTPDAAEAGDIPDPCSLLSAADIEAVSGVAFQPGVFNEDLSTDFQSICDYSPVDGVFPLVQVLVSPGEAQVATQRSTAGDMLGGTVDVTVSGASDAYAVAGGSIVGMAANGYFVQLSYMSSDVADVTSTTVSLAEVVVGAL